MELTGHNTVTPLAILSKYWGYTSFRPLQEEIIQAPLNGLDCLALLPTGGGKSVCFQVPALCQPGYCLVISPLIALMKDQVQQLTKRNIKAAAIYSGMSRQEIDRILDNARHAHYQFLYLSPERLGSEELSNRLINTPVSLIAVDEAHCISQWGYDFRPSYLNISPIRDLLPDVPVIALTATATPEVVQDIQEKLAFRKGAKVFQKSFVRDNLSYSVLPVEDKWSRMLDVFKNVPGSGLVYVRNRRQTKEVALYLRKHQIVADYYHAGRNVEERSSIQDQWINGTIRIIVATNAFGMGIDKPDVRTVVHLDLPDNLEAYFQEAGRAGRDEKKSYAVLLYNKSDQEKLNYNFQVSFPDLKIIRQVYRALASYLQVAIGSPPGYATDFNIADFCEKFKLDAAQTLSVLKTLEQDGWLSLTESVYQPSTVQVLLEKEKLYDFQIKNKAFDPLIKLLLRNLQGVFADPVAFREDQLAKAAGINIADFVRMLSWLHQQNVIQYHPRKDAPQLILLRERVDPSNLTIDMKQYLFRKNRYEERMQTAIAYAESPVCRQKQLVAYFGEYHTQVCGKCDVCTGRTKSQLANSEFDVISQQILLRVKSKPESIRQVIHSFNAPLRPKVLQVLAFLLDERQIKKENELLYVWEE